MDFEAGFFDRGEGANAERCVYGKKISSRCFPKPVVCVSLRHVWRKSAPKFFRGGVFSYHPCGTVYGSVCVGRGLSCCVRTGSKSVVVLKRSKQVTATDSFSGNARASTCNKSASSAKVGATTWRLLCFVTSSEFGIHDLCCRDFLRGRLVLPLGSHGLVLISTISAGKR